MLKPVLFALILMQLLLQVYFQSAEVSFPSSVKHHNEIHTVDSRYLEFQGTL